MNTKSIDFNKTKCLSPAIQIFKVIFLPHEESLSKYYAIPSYMATIENAREHSPVNPREPEISGVFEKAAAEGFNNVATLYKAASEAEAIHAKNS